MNAKIASIISFVVGALSGTIGTYIFIRKKYDDEFQKKRDEMIAYYQNKVGKQETTEPPAVLEEDKETDMMEEARRLSEENGYKRPYHEIDRVVTMEETPPYDPSNDTERDLPYIVDGVEFGSQEGYEMCVLNCYEDGVVTDEKNEVLTEDDIEECVGSKNIDQLYRVEGDSIYVRNDRLKRDYDIIERIGRYADE